MTALGSTLSSFSRRPFVRNVIAVAGGTAAAQAITMAFAPIITRLYGPEAFGVQGVFMSLVSILAPIVSFTYPSAIVLPKSPAVARAISLLSLVIALFTASIVGIVVIFIPIYVDLSVFRDNNSFLVYFLPAGVFLTAVLQIVTQWSVRLERFSDRAKSDVKSSIVINFTRILFGLISPIASTLVSISSVAPGIQAVLLWRRLKNEKIVSSIRLSRLWDIARKFRGFPLYRAPEAMLSALSISLPTLLLGMYSAEAAGFYALARSVLKMPGTLLAKSFGDVLYPKYARNSHNKNKLIEILWKSTGVLAILCLFPFGTIILFGPLLFGLAFGEEWLPSGQYGQWIAVLLYANFVFSPSNHIFAVINRQKIFLLYRMLNIVVTSTALFIGLFIYSSDSYAIALYSCSGAFMSIVMFFVCIRVCMGVSNEK